jgi:hypothetical protein
MEKKVSSIYWGLILIAGGGIAIAQAQGYLTDLSPIIWITIFAVISIISLISFFASSTQSWSLLFPTGIFGGLAILIALAVAGVDNPVMAAPLFVGIGMPFVVAYFLNRQQNWWALIPAAVMVFLIFALLAAQNLGGEVVGAGLFFFLAAAFGFVYWKKQARWAALTAYILLVLGFIPLLAASPRPELAAIIIMFAAALPFSILYIRQPEKWWSIIPAGIFLTMGLVILIMLGMDLYLYPENSQLANALALTGTSATFAVVWFRHHKNWAKIVTCLFALGAAAAFFGDGIQTYWPFIVILAGIFLLFMAFRPKTV